jgi:GNAT superfamily N-acetyltransferase
VDYGIFRNGGVYPIEIEDLREAVGWDRSEGTYEEILCRHYAYYTVRAGDDRLFGYMSVLSDGISDAFLIDLMVHPDHRNRGIGRKLVRQGIKDMRDAGIRAVQVIFNNDLREFYEHCGFFVLSAGMIDFKVMNWESEDTAPGLDTHDD